VEGLFEDERNTKEPEMKKIILDTNFLLIPAQFGVDIFDEISRICNFEYELLVLDKSIDELKKIVRTEKGKNRAAAKLALALVKAKTGLMKTKSGKGVDDLLVELSRKDCIIATQDRLLKRKLKTPIIVLRQKRHLQLIN
jgi:hypothetical protein